MVGFEKRSMDNRVFQYVQSHIERHIEYPWKAELYFNTIFVNYSPFKLHCIVPNGIPYKNLPLPTLEPNNVSCKTKVSNCLHLVTILVTRFLDSSGTSKKCVVSCSTIHFQIFSAINKTY